MPTIHDRAAARIPAGPAPAAPRPAPASVGAEPLHGDDPGPATGARRAETRPAPRRAGLAALAGPVMVAVAIQSVTNLVVHSVLGRVLTVADYGAMGAVLAAMTLVAVPLTALQTSAARLAADRLTAGTARAALRRAGLLLLPPTALVLVLAGPVAGYLHLGSVGDAALVAPLLLASGLVSTGRGLLLGSGRSRAVAASFLVGSFARLLLALSLAAVWGVSGALVGTVLGELAALVLVLVSLRSTRSGPVQVLRLAEVGRTTLVVTGLFAFTTVDLFLARHHLPSTESGLYVAAATIGKTILALPAAAMSVAFPRLVSAWNSAPAGGRAPARILGQSLLLVGAPAVLASLAVLAAPGLVMGLLYGPAYAGAEGLVRALALIAATSALVSVLAHAGMARGSVTAFVPWLGALVEVAVIRAWHDSSMAVAAGSAGALALVLAVLGALEVRAWRRVPAPDRVPVGPAS